jgi:NAD(P)-dependent dehydrogenase (short-subunit alcohol dehydrogenase family)
VKDLKDKVAFITGGASGIGLGIAKACARHGMKVVIVDSRQDALDEAMKYFKEKNLPAHPIKLDVTNREDYVKAADEAERVFGKIHVLVNNAGVASGGLAQMCTFKDWDFSVGVNITGTANGLVIILPRILKHGEGGHVVSTSSTAGFCAVNGNIIYNTTKYAIAGMMETLAGELMGTNVGASVLIPGPTSTNLGQSTFANRPEHLRNEGQAWPPGPPPGRQGPPPEQMRAMMEEMKKIFMDPVETGERVVRGIMRNDIFIHTHPEFKAGYIARSEALIRAIPDEPANEKRADMIKKMGTLAYNPVYEKQTTPGAPDWEQEER